MDSPRNEQDAQSTQLSASNSISVAGCRQLVIFLMTNKENGVLVVDSFAATKCVVYRHSRGVVLPTHTPQHHQSDHSSSVT